MEQKIVLKIIVLLIVSLFFYTGINKMLEIDLFKEQISQFSLFKPVADVLAWVLPLTELAVSFILCVPKWRLGGLYAFLSMMIMFTIYLVILINLHSHAMCGCGGAFDQLSWETHLLINSIFIILALVAIFLERRVSKFKFLSKMAFKIY